MDLRDAIAIPTTLVFLIAGFYGVVVLRLRGIRRRARGAGLRSPGRWQHLSRRQKTMRRIAGVALGVVLAVALQVLVRGLMEGF